MYFTQVSTGLTHRYSVMFFKMDWKQFYYKMACESLP